LCGDPRKILTLSLQYMAPFSAPSKPFNISTRDIYKKRKKGSRKRREGDFQHANAKEAKKD
jgi:hypothetical protein